MANQQENILAVATELFYDQGYDKTYFYQIAERLGITKPLISYYFKSKSHLAKKVSENYTSQCKNNIALKLYQEYFQRQKYDLQLSTAIEIRLLDTLTFTDPKVKRFVSESANGHFEDIFQSNYKSFFKIHDRHYHLKINHQIDEVSLLSRGYVAASMAIRLGFFNDEFSCSMEECLDYSIEMLFRFMRVDEKRIQEIIDKSKEVIEQIDFQFEPYFIIR
jgi:AcrR family transcriptional regulator